MTRSRECRGGRTEHLFWQSGGGYDRNITNRGTLLKMADYIHNNPVRRGLAARRWTGRGRVRDGTRVSETCRW
jgi:hypothetical protein